VSQNADAFLAVVNSVMLRHGSPGLIARSPATAPPA
jgi:hypothetical protein